MEFFFFKEIRQAIRPNIYIYFSSMFRIYIKIHKFQQDFNDNNLFVGWLNHSSLTHSSVWTGKCLASSLVRVCRSPAHMKWVGCPMLSWPVAYSKWALSSIDSADRTNPTPPPRSGPGWYTLPLTGCMKRDPGQKGMVSLAPPPQYDRHSSCPASDNRCVKTTGRSSQRRKLHSRPQSERKGKSWS